MKVERSKVTMSMAELKSLFRQIGYAAENSYRRGFCHGVVSNSTIDDALWFRFDCRSSSDKRNGIHSKAQPAPWDGVRYGVNTGEPSINRVMMESGPGELMRELYRVVGYEQEQISRDDVHSAFREAIAHWRGPRGDIRWAKDHRTFEEAHTMLANWDHELGQVRAVFGTWAVTDDGVECLIYPYYIAKDRVTKESRNEWMEHVPRKTWMQGLEEDFRLAFDYAKQHPRRQVNEPFVAYLHTEERTRQIKSKHIDSADDDEEGDGKLRVISFGELSRWNKKRRIDNMVKFFKDGKALAIQTDATDEREFTQDFAIAFEDYITGEKFEGQHEIIRWLNGYAEVCCKMRGYKADVKEQRLITFGDVNPQSEALVTSVANGTQVLKQEAVA